MVERPVICLGQYKAISKQCILTKKMCTHKGKFHIFPKDEGCGISIPAFQS